MSAEDDVADETKMRTEAKSHSRWWTVLKAVILTGIGVAALLVLFFFDLEEKLPAFLAWVEDNKLLGTLYFIGIFTLWTVLCLPTLILNMGAGVVLQPLGFAVMACWLGCIAGQTCSFLLGRFLFRDYVYSHSGQYKLWRALERSMEKEGWRITFLLRLCILLPFDVLNYILGASPVAFMDYTTASAIGIIPGVLFFCLLGKYVEDFTGIESTPAEESAITTTTVVVSVLSGVVLFLILGMLTYYTKVALDQIIKEDAEKHVVEDEATQTTDLPSGKGEKGASQPTALQDSIPAGPDTAKADSNV